MNDAEPNIYIYSSAAAVAVARRFAKILRKKNATLMMIERRSWLVAAAESESVKIIRFNLLDLPKIGSAAATTTGDIFRVEVSKRVLYGAMFNKYMFFSLPPLLSPL